VSVLVALGVVVLIALCVVSNDTNDASTKVSEAIVLHFSKSSKRELQQNVDNQVEKASRNSLEQVRDQKVESKPIVKKAPHQPRVQEGEVHKGRVVVWVVKMLVVLHILGILYCFASPKSSSQTTQHKDNQQMLERFRIWRKKVATASDNNQKLERFDIWRKKVATASDNKQRGLPIFNEAKRKITEQTREAKRNPAHIENFVHELLRVDERPAIECATGKPDKIMGDVLICLIFLYTGDRQWQLPCFRFHQMDRHVIVKGFVEFLQLHISPHRMWMLQNANELINRNDSCVTLANLITNYFQCMSDLWRYILRRVRDSERD